MILNSKFNAFDFFMQLFCYSEEELMLYFGEQKYISPFQR
jgi:hypothetical protein